MYPNETNAQTPNKYPIISTGRLAQVANSLQIIRSVIGTPRPLDGLSDSQKTSAVFDGLHQGANQDAVLRSALVLAAEPKLLDKVRDEFADQQSLHYSADRNRNFYIAGDPEDLRAAAQTFDKMFEQTIPTLKTPTPVRLAPQTQPSNATSLEPRERTAPNSLLKREPVQSQSAKPIDKPAVTSGNGSKVIGQTGNVPRFPGKPPLPAPQVTIGNVQPNGADVRANLGPKTANVGPNLGKQIPGTSGARVVGGNVVPQTTVSTLQPKTGNVAPTLSNPQDTNAPPKTIPPPIPVRPQRPGGTSPNALVAENKLTASVPVPTNRVAELKAKLDHNHIIQGHK